MNRQTEEAVAVKVIDTSQAKECADNVKKEVCVHKVGQLFTFGTFIDMGKDEGAINSVHRCLSVFFSVGCLECDAHKHETLQRLTHLSNKNNK